MKHLKVVGMTALLAFSLVTLTACGGGGAKPAAAPESKPAASAPAPATTPEPATAPAPAATPAPATTPAPADDKKVDTSKGREIFAGKGACLGCHMLGTEGVATIGPNLDKVGTKYNGDVAKLARILTDASGEGLLPTMPPAPVSEAEKKDLAEFLASLK